jgi:hypothetical protein
MNRLSTAKWVHVVAALVEGVSINPIERMTGLAKHTITEAAGGHGLRPGFGLVDLSSWRLSFLMETVRCCRIVYLGSSTLEFAGG